jgi:hypothetical protein
MLTSWSSICHTVWNFSWNRPLTQCLLSTDFENEESTTDSTNSKLDFYHIGFVHC